MDCIAKSNNLIRFFFALVDNDKLEMVTKEINYILLVDRQCLETSCTFKMEIKNTKRTAAEINHEKINNN